MAVARTAERRRQGQRHPRSSASAGHDRAVAAKPASSTISRAREGRDDRHFEGDLTKALFGFDGVVGNFASPRRRTGPCSPSSVGEAAGAPAPGAMIGGMGSITQ
jgi:hypothetical protein